MILGLCDRFRVTPPEAERLPASVLRLLAIERLAYPERYEDPEGPLDG